MEQITNNDPLQQAWCTVKNPRLRTNGHTSHDQLTHEGPVAINIHLSCHTKFFSCILLNEGVSDDLLYRDYRNSTTIVINNESMMTSAFEVLKEKVRTLCMNISEEWCEHISRKARYGILSAITSSFTTLTRSPIIVFDFDVEILLEHYSYVRVEDIGIDDLMVPATNSSIESLETKIIDCEESGFVCSICLEEFLLGEQSTSMPCSHLFHGNCIETWLNTSHYCPICRFQMPTAS